ncbi:MAG: methyltransferase domain-containing protein [Bacteroidota bacterium]
MDDLNLEGEELNKTLENLSWVNQWLGSHLSVRNGFDTGLRYLAESDLPSPIRVMDVGCGGGDCLRMLAKWAKKRAYSVHLSGLDANPHIIDWARNQSGHSPDIDYVCANVFDNNIPWQSYQIVHCGLFFHHFSEQEQLQLLNRWREAGVKMVLINDLQRHWLPYFLFQIVSTLLGFTPMAKTDGALSIQRGFTRKELTHLMKQYSPRYSRCRWRWAFQYQLIMIP